MISCEAYGRAEVAKEDGAIVDDFNASLVKPHLRKPEPRNVHISASGRNKGGRVSDGKYAELVEGRTDKAKAKNQTEI